MYVHVRKGTMVNHITCAPSYKYNTVTVVLIEMPPFFSVDGSQRLAMEFDVADFVT